MVPDAAVRFLAAALAVALAISLTFASIELPKIANRALAEVFDAHEEPARDAAAHLDLFPGVDSGRNPEVTEAFFRRYHVRPIGYTCLAVVALLIGIGLTIESRTALAVGGAAIFLPVFGHFAFSMFFLAGLGFLRVLWIPMLDLSHWLTGDPGHWLFRLGDVGHLPYMAATWLTALFGLDSRKSLAFGAMGVGFLLFLLAMNSWFRARMEGRDLAQRGLYSWSRHPQYLGWIVWSYGLVSYLSQEGSKPNFKITWGIPDSLPWLIGAAVIIGVAMLEEMRLQRELGQAHEDYRRASSFLFPLPGPIAVVLSVPMRLVLRRQGWPGSGGEVAAVLVVYILLAMGLSLAMIVADLPPGGHLTAWPYSFWPFR